MTTLTEQFLMSVNTSMECVVDNRSDYFIIKQDNSYWKWMIYQDEEIGKYSFTKLPNAQVQCVDCEKWYDDTELTENDHCQRCVHL